MTCLGPNSAGAEALELCSNADLHKLGGIEVIASLLDDNSSDAVRASAAFALGIAASSNEPFIVELTQRGGDDVMIQLVEVPRL